MFLNIRKIFISSSFFLILILIFNINNFLTGGYFIYLPLGSRKFDLFERIIFLQMFLNIRKIFISSFLFNINI